MLKVVGRPARGRQEGRSRAGADGGAWSRRAGRHARRGRRDGAARAAGQPGQDDLRHGAAGRTRSIRARCSARRRRRCSAATGRRRARCCGRRATWRRRNSARRWPRRSATCKASRAFSRSPRHIAHAHRHRSGRHEDRRALPSPPMAASSMRRRIPAPRGNYDDSVRAIAGLVAALEDGDRASAARSASAFPARSRRRPA